VTHPESRLGQLAHKVRELDPGSRALLDLSVRRGLGDGEIAGALGTDPSYIASTRTGVMASIAADLRLDDRERAELEDALARLPADAWLPKDQPEPEPSADNGAAYPRAAAEPEPEPETVTRPTRETEPAAVAAEPEPAAVVAEPQPEPGKPPAPARRRRRRGLLAAVLVVALLAAGLVFASTTMDDDDRAAEPAAPAERESRPPPENDAERERRSRRQPERGRSGRTRGEPLRPLPGSKGGRGTARLDGRRLVVSVSGLPRPARRYQVWLYDSLIEARPLGRLRAAGRSAFRGRFRVRGARRYRYVDISVEPRNGNGNHSGRSIMRIATRKLR
jgi:Anti-sigma-K factor rskA